MPKLQEALKDKDELTQRKRVYLAGGTVWALTTFVKPEDRGDTVELTPGDFMAFAKLLNDRTGELPDPDLSRVADAEVKKRALEDAAQVRKTFTRDQLIAGTEVLNALVEGFHLDAKDKHLHFARQAYIGWLLGYVIEKAQAPK